MPKPRICHRCGKPITGYFCPCRRRRSTSSRTRSSGGGRSGSARRAPVSPSFSGASAQAVPMWESNPDRFWSQVVETVRMSHASDGTRFATAIWPGHEQTFVLNEVAPLLARYFQL
ncbi:MAG: hypothetical protein EHM48_00125 [Planctomycetaceae bacterium]|nr:MAG: hypothetical protein EHM48_00125 [Planctomycetaceae bacterium]